MSNTHKNNNPIVSNPTDEEVELLSIDEIIEQESVLDEYEEEGYLDVYEGDPEELSFRE